MMRWLAPRGRHRRPRRPNPPLFLPEPPVAWWYTGLPQDPWIGRCHTDEYRVVPGKATQP